jgi:hypothetical protein
MFASAYLPSFCAIRESERGTGMRGEKKRY